MKANGTKDRAVVDSSSNEKVKQCLTREELLIEGCDSENVVCSLIVYSKGEVFGIGEVVTFGDLEKLLRVIAYYVALWPT